MNDSNRVLVGLAVGLGAGVVAGSLDGAAAETLARWVEPAGTLWFNAIRLAIIPLLMACVFTAVVQSRDLRTLGRMGLAAVLPAVIILGFSAAASLGLGPVLLRNAPVAAGTLERLRQHYATTTQSVAPVTSLEDWFVQLLPANPFKALADGNILPLILATIALAAAARTVAASKRAPLEQLSTAVTEISFVWIRWVLKLAPLGVFALIFAVSVRAGRGMAVALVFYVLVTAVVSVVVTAALYLVAALSRVVSMGQFARAMLTPQIIGFTSRSSVAALPAMIEASEQQLKLPDEVTRAFLPFLVSIFRVAGSIVICVGAVFVAWLYGIPLHGNQLLTVGLLSMVLSFAVPGIPSGGIFVSAPVLAAVGLPVEAIGILLAVDPLSDMFRTVANVTAHLSLSTLAARILLGKRTSA